MIKNVIYFEKELDRALDFESWRTKEEGIQRIPIKDELYWKVCVGHSFDDDSSSCNTNRVEVCENGKAGMKTANLNEIYNYLKEMGISPKETLWIAGSKECVKAAQELKIAVLGYHDPDVHMSEFLKVEYVIEGFSEIDDDFLKRIYQRYHNEPWTILETDRCVVRELTLEDMDALFELYAKPGMTDFVEPLYEYDEELEYERAYIKHMYRYYGYGMWLVFLKENGELIGRAGLENRDYPDGTEIELGYMIATEYQNKGLATEVCHQIIEYAREMMGIDRINCLIEKENIASIALVEKLGFSFYEESDVTGEILSRYVVEL